MTQHKRHTCQLTDSLINKIEYVLPKIKYSAYFNTIKNWLENFEEDEVDLALDFLFYLEYITFSELQSRLDEQLKKILHDIDKDILLIPFAEYPKSGDLMLYLITKLETYQRNGDRIFFTKDPLNYEKKEETTLVFLDDFIGSGKSLAKWFSENHIDEIITAKKFSQPIIVLAAITMESAKHFLEQKTKSIKFYSEIRNKIFSKQTSPFNLINSTEEMKKLCLKYGSDIKVSFQRPNKPIFWPLGYEETEALVAFDYGTPNNTLSIIWGEANWFPIFPRASKSRIASAKRIKKDVHFYLGIMNKLGIVITDNLTIEINKKKIYYSSREDYSMLVVLLLKEKKYHNIMICQQLGITMTELSKIHQDCRTKRLLDRENQPTKLALNFIAILKKQDKIYKFRENDSLNIKKDSIFIPGSFDGKT